MTRVALATCAALPRGPASETSLTSALAARGLEAEWRVWDDPEVDWAAAELVLIRSTWDYVDRRDRYLAWAEHVGTALHNPPELVAWSTDKAYLPELAAAGLPVVPTTLLVPGDEPTPLGSGEWVVKPAISAGARDTGRWDAPAAHRHASEILASGRTVLLQPYLPGVEDGEASLVWIDGELSHAMRKRAFLTPGETAPVRNDGSGLTAAEAMYADDLLTPLTPDPEQLALGADVLAWLTDRFGVTPLYARTDLIPGPDGAPVVLEIELVEPSLWLDAAPGAADRLAAGLARREARRRAGGAA